MLFAPTCVRKTFMQIIKNLETQKTQSLCGAATAVTILNSMPAVEKAIDPW